MSLLAIIMVHTARISDVDSVIFVNREGQSSVKKYNETFFSSCYEHGIKKRFRVPMRN